MSQVLGQLFEYQRFQKNSHLDALIRATEARYQSMDMSYYRELSDEDLTLVNAAGDIYVNTDNTKKDKIYE